MSCLLHHLLFKRQIKQLKKKQGSSFTKAFCLLICALCVQAGIHAQQQHTYHNADSANPILNASPKPCSIKQMQFFDVDGDGDLDCYMMLAGNKLVLYRNVGNINRPEYQLADSTGFESVTLVTTPFQQHFAFFDMDGDGDKDAFLEGYHEYGGKSSPAGAYIAAYKNDGSPQKPHFTGGSFGALNLPNFVGDGYIFFTFQDIDGDGDSDFVYYSNPSAYIPEVLFGYHQNIGTSASGTAYFNSNSSPYVYVRLLNPQSFHDFTGDGLPDCLEYTLGSTTFFPNIGTKANPQIDAVNHPNGVTPPKAADFGDIGAASLVDLNNDGKLEVFNDTGHYATATPVPVLKATVTYNNAGKPVTKLTATVQLPGYKYRWEYNGQTVAGNTKPTINASKAGKYVLYIKDKTGIGVSLPYVTPAQAANSARELIVSTKKPAVQAITAQVYPNPFVQSMTLKFSGSGSSITRTIRVTDMSGKVWLAQTTSSSNVQLGSTLPKGMYQLEVWEHNALVYHTKILKQ